jgi:hypothetical protein
LRPNTINRSLPIRDAANRTASTIFPISLWPAFPPVIPNTATLGIPPADISLREFVPLVMDKFAPTGMKNAFTRGDLIHESFSPGTVNTAASETRRASRMTRSCERRRNPSITLVPL